MSEPGTNEGHVVFVGDGAAITGTLHAQNSIVINGTVQGTITCGHLIVGQGGVEEGQIAVDDAEIHGKVGPHIDIKQLLAIGSSGRIEGEWTYGELAVEKGGILRGSTVFNDPGSVRKVA
jgi:cytoskeletal protein CcmA (bactofilin family)